MYNKNKTTYNNSRSNKEQNINIKRFKIIYTIKPLENTRSKNF